jgi:hypothetical protein
MNYSRVVRSSLLFIFFLFSLIAPSLSAQNPSGAAADSPAANRVANGEVLKLLKAGMPESVVLEKIRAASSKFDTSTDALIKLKTAGATDAELNAILANGASTAAPDANATAETPKTHTAKSTRVQAPHIVVEPKRVVANNTPKPEPTLLNVDVPMFEEKNLIGSETGGSGMMRISADGHAAFGVLNTAGGSNGIYRITDKGEKQRLDNGEPGGIALLDVTPDGSELLASLTEAKGNRRFLYWNSALGFHDLGQFPATSLRVSADGERFVASGGDLTYYIRFKEGKKVGLARDCEKCKYWFARDIVISASSSNLEYIAGTYAPDKHAATQGFLKGHGEKGEPLGEGFYPKLVSEDGNTIFGQSDPHAGHIIRWTRQGGREDLGTFGGVQATVARISPDGSSVVGWYLDNRIQTHIFRWSKETGMQDLGITGVKVNQIADVSADGKTFVAQTVDQGITKQYLVPFADLTARREARLKEVIEQRKAENEAKAVADAEFEARAQKEAKTLQVRVDQTLAGGHPANLYALGLDLESDQYPEQATQIYKYLIAKYPDDSFAERATERMEHAHDAAIAKAAQDEADKKAAEAAAKQAADQQSTQQAQLAQIEQQTQAALDCINKCQSNFDSCQKPSDRANNAAVALSVLGALVPGGGALETAAGAAGVAGMAGDLGGSSCFNQNVSCLDACSK